MNEETSKRLAEYVGVCWHEWEAASDICALPFNDRRSGWRCAKCGDEMVSVHVVFGSPKNPDFTTPDGFQLLADKLTERGEWEAFDIWLWKTQKSRTVSMGWWESKQPAEKSQLIDKALEAGAIGSQS